MRKTATKINSFWRFLDAKKQFFYATILFCFLFEIQANPFIQMLNRDYADYYQEWLYEFHKFETITDMTEALKIIKQIEEVAEKTGCNEWLLRVELFKLELFLITGWKLASEKDPEFSKKYTEKAQSLLKSVTNANLPQLELLIKYRMIEIYSYFFNDFQSTSELMFQINRLLQTVSFNDVPEKSRYHVHFGNSLLRFKDYETAYVYFNKALENDNCEPIYKRHALNGLAVYYRDAYKDYDRADEYLQAILQVNYTGVNKEQNDGIWRGIVYGNLGGNMFLRGEYDKAIELYKQSLDESIKYGEYGYATHIVVFLADIYTRKNNLTQAKHYIDLAWEIAIKHESSPRWGWHYYEVMSMYYAASGNFQKSRIYMDSTLQTQRERNERYNASMLLRLEQNEQALQFERLTKEEERRVYFQRLLLIISIAFILISILLIFLFIVYRRRNATYRALVHKSQQWAQIQSETDNNEEKLPEEQLLNEAEVLQSETEAQKPPDQTDLFIMKEIERMMTDEKLYKEVSLTVDLLAQKLGMKPYNVSIAINKCTQKNFNTYINEFRIKEAIILLSQKKLTVDRIAFECGLNDRKNFYRVFKKMTGLSPTEFRNNLST